MASEVSSTSSKDAPTFGFDQPDSPAIGETLATLLRPLASLRLTVVLFFLAILLIFAGTLAQVDKDIWDVMRLYFRTWVARVEFQIFFPKTFFPNMPPVPGAIYFPGGWLIGGAMMINLLAAHSLRFKVQASGTRLWSGLGVIALGTLLTVLVVLGGDNKDGLQDLPLMSWQTLWHSIVAGLGAGGLASLYAATRLSLDRRVERTLLFVLGGGLASVFAWLLVQGSEAALSESSLRILWQLVKGGIAGLVMLGGCIMVFKKRGGIVLLHAGVGLMMANELVVHLWHSEGQMHITEGQTINYVQDIRKLELVVIDPSVSEKEDRMTVVPQSVLLGTKDAIAHADLPFDIHLVKFFQNSDLKRIKPGEDSLATAGAGLEWMAEEVRAGTGTDVGGEIDISSAYLRFTKKGSSDSLGTHLLSVSQSLQNVPEHVEVDGKTYDLYLRFKRTYKPYSMALRDVRFDKYMGTNTPKNYSSELQLVDGSRKVQRDVKIWMNNPLRYAGETFYQSSFNVDPSTGRELTGLQVVSNTGWMIPYVACMLVMIGMLAHFVVVLLRFLQRRTGSERASLGAIFALAFGGLPGIVIALSIISSLRHAKTDESKPDKSRKSKENDPPSRNIFGWVVPLAVVLVVFGGWLSSKARMPKSPDGLMRLEDFGKLPIVYQGRIKPFDTLARNSLRVISDAEEFEDADGKKQPAIRWLLDLIAKPSAAAEHKVVRIQNLEVLDTLGLERRPGFRYAVNEFSDKMEKFDEQSRQARQKEHDKVELSVYEKKTLELDNRLRLYTVLLAAFDQPRIRPDNVQQDLMAIVQHQRQTLTKMDLPLAVPPDPAETKDAKDDDDHLWEPYSRAYVQAWAQTNVMGQSPNPATLSLNTLLVSYAKGEVADFNLELRNYQAALAKNPPRDLKPDRINFEAFFNHFAPFYHSAALYVIAFLLTACSWLGWSKPLNRTAFWLIVLTFCVHTFALFARMIISERWGVMVTNLYSSAIFIGWAGVLFGMILEVVYRLSIGNIIASVAGFSTLLIAHFLSADGDTFTVMQAVLDTNFWLATHVTCITLGYASTYVAGLLGVIYILAGLSPSFVSDISKDLARMIYGILCFAILFSFVGTVLGGLWADDSWGRFWGWDPKENGALIIVLWNALVLHARWGGLVKERGLAVLAIGGNIATSWSWFGVNQLGAGLHSYGFTEGVALALGVFCLSQFALIGLGIAQAVSAKSSRPAVESTAA